MNEGGGRRLYLSISTYLGAGKAIEKPAFLLAVLGLQLIYHHTADRLIGHELTPVHVALGLQAQRRTLLHSRP